MKLALSSCWNSHRHSDGYEMIEEVVGLGFNHIELSHGIRIALVPGILHAVEEGLIKVSSVHNFCPLPTGVMGAAPNLYEPTARGAQEQDLWFRHTLKTLDFAARVRADLMVIHSGSMHFLFGNPEPRLEKLMEAAREDETLKPPMEAYREKALARLRKRHVAPRRRLIQNFQRIAPYARERAIRVAVENREGFIELPLDEDMPALLAELDEPEVFGYWHDTGHAQLKEEQGIIKHAEQLERNRARQFGFHLHDVSDTGRDHQEIGSGVTDWSMVSRFFRQDDLLVLEMSPRLKTAAVAASKKAVEALVAEAGLTLDEAG